MAARTVLAAALSPEHGAEARAIDDRISLKVAREADIAIWHVELRITKTILRFARVGTVRRFMCAGDGTRI